MARPTLLRLHEASGGNPFYALELARALGEEGAVRDPTLPLPVPARLEELVSARLAGFTGVTREALVLASAHARLTVPELGDLGIERSALDPALAENVIELERDTVRFTHPLLASVLYQGLSAEERQRTHGRLAEFAGRPGRARSAPRPVDGPAGRRARDRARAGGNGRRRPGGADRRGRARRARASPHSRPEPADADRRAFAAARADLAAGGVERARELADELVARAPAGAERAEALVLMAQVERTTPDA